MRWQCMGSVRKACAEKGNAYQVFNFDSLLARSGLGQGKSVPNNG